MCDLLLVPRLRANVDSDTYIKGGPNSITIDTDDCTGLTSDASGHFATVTVTYEQPDFPLAIRSGCRPAGKSRFKYKDPAGTHDGISRLLLRGGPPGKSNINLIGKGAALSDAPLPLSPASGIRVQLTNEETGVCWESEFPVSDVGGNISVRTP